MTKKVLAFGASNSSKSINKRLAHWASTQLEDVIISFIDLNDYEMPIYSIDREEQKGIPAPAQKFRDLINESDGILISFAEHNGGFTVAFKNLFDWATRLGKDIWNHKPMFLMATSPGKRGGKSVLESAVTRFNFMGAGEINHFSLPSFHENFNHDNGITDETILSQFEEQLKNFRNRL